jgi:S1-C subfamily serine protease
MVANQHSHVKSAHKKVKLKAHHAKPYRKRHVGLLVVSIAALVVLALVLIQYRDQIIGGFASSRGFVSDLFTENKNATTTTVTSSHGFNLTFDQKQFYGSAISDDTGNLYLGSDLGQQRAYTVVRVAPSYQTGANSTNTSSALTFTYHAGKTQTVEPADTVALIDGGVDPNNVDRVATALTSIDGQVFKKTTWQSKADGALVSSLSAKFVTYSALVRGQVVTVVLSLGVTGVNESIYQPILDSITFDAQVSVIAAPTAEVVAKTQASQSILDTILGTQVAAAASTTNNLTGSERVAALYSPAVVKIYNAYKMDVLVDGKPFVKNVTDAYSGSGFFVSQDGYIATNGHVGAVTPIDIAVSAAISAIQAKGDSSYFIALLNLTSLKTSDFPANSTDTQKLAIMVDAIYKLDSSRFTAANNVQNMLVQVTPKNPDITALVQDTLNGTEYRASDTNVLKAKLVAANYRAVDNIDGFKASDVAIIKVDGSNFPVTKLGSISDVTQGAGLSILGYPGEAGTNELVDTTSSQATLTNGKVSSIKTAGGSGDKKLIETDTTIGHGNSGGPALDDDGDVVGLATYSVDGSGGSGNGTYNYIRDIKDLTDLATANHITFDTNSATQTEWEKGLNYFYTAHYSKAVVSFNKVKTLYPNDSNVASFITASEKRIANGEDVVDFPLIPVIIAAVVILLGIGVALLLIVRHHKKHMIYAAGVAQGSVQPAGPDAPKKQTVTVSADGATISSTAPTTATVEVAQAPAADAPGTSVTISVTKAEEPVEESETPPTETGSAYGESTYNPAPPAEETPAPIAEDPKPESSWFTPEPTTPEAPKEEPK